LRDRFSVPRNNDLLCFFDGTDQLRQPVFGFGNAEIHISIIAISYGYNQAQRHRIYRSRSQPSQVVVQVQ